jgi:hypothetical protein
MSEKFYCKWCGMAFSSVTSLTSCSCGRNPEHKRHELYEGDEKSKYTCKYCGMQFSSLSALTSCDCPRNTEHDKHEPAL